MLHVAAHGWRGSRGAASTPAVLEAADGETGASRNPGTRLDLVLARGRGGLGRGGLEQLDGRRRVLLQLLERVLRLLEGRLQLLEELVVLLLGVGHGLLHRLELRRALRSVHVNVRLQGRELPGRAVLLRVDRAARAELGLDALGERREVAAALVVLALLVGRVVVLDRGVATNAVLVAQRLAARRAINIRDDNRLGVLELVAKGVPSRFHRLAMPSPGRKELDERRLARIGNLRLPVLLSELGGTRRNAGQGAEEHQTTHHLRR